jgi:hypothetical protein
MVSIPACHMATFALLSAGDRGSIPRQRVTFFPIDLFYKMDVSLLDVNHMRNDVANSVQHKSGVRNQEQANCFFFVSINGGTSPPLRN